MLKKLFSPATHLMNKLKFNFKFTLIMMLFFLPLLILTFSYFSEVNRLYKHTKNELSGLTAIHLLDKQQEQLIKIVIDDMARRAKKTIADTQADSIIQFNNELIQIAKQKLFSEQESNSLIEAIDKSHNKLVKTLSSATDQEQTLLITSIS